MRIRIDGDPRMEPLEIKGAKAIVMASMDDTDESKCPVFVMGEMFDVLLCGHVVLQSLRSHMGERRFKLLVDGVVNGLQAESTDLTHLVRKEVAP